jgi:hypothetical protein
MRCELYIRKWICKVKKSKAIPLLHEGGVIQLLLVIDLGIRWGEWSASCPSPVLPQGKGPPIPTGWEAAGMIYGGLGGPQSSSGHRDYHRPYQHRHYTDLSILYIYTHTHTRIVALFDSLCCMRLLSPLVSYMAPILFHSVLPSTGLII